MAALSVGIKERLIATSYSLVCTRELERFSLGKLSRLVGITKAAIYRHFKSKEELLQCLEEDFFSQVKELFEGIDSKWSESSIEEKLGVLFEFFLKERPELFAYFLRTIASRPDFEVFFHERLMKKGYVAHDFFGLIDRREDGGIVILERHKFYLSSFIHTALIGFMALYCANRNKGVAVCTPCQYAHNVLECLSRGIKEIGEIDEAKVRALKKVVIQSRKDTMTQKLFCALSRVIQRAGFEGVTVEAVAEEVGLAKSSLYNYFSTKNDMICSLIVREFNFLDEDVRLNVPLANSRVELFVIHIFTVLGYFIANPYAIRVFSYLRYDEIRNTILHDYKNGYESPLLNGIELSEMGIALTSKDYMNYLMTFPLTLALQQSVYNLSEDDVIKCIAEMVHFVSGGLDIGYVQEEMGVPIPSSLLG